jgi:hypothetical protein
VVEAVVEVKFEPLMVMIILTMMIMMVLRVEWWSNEELQLMYKLVT